MTSGERVACGYIGSTFAKIKRSELLRARRVGILGGKFAEIKRSELLRARSVGRLQFCQNK